jgi:membrane carboxypeptidase/penicillin-binding protein
MDRGYTPASMIVDAPITLIAGNGRTWMPQNYDDKFIGPTTLRNALAHSRNVVTVKLAQSMGLNYLVNYLPRFGFTRPLAKNLSIALGTTELTLFELARGYTAFATGGRRLDPLFITKITDPHGKVLEEFEAPSDPVIAPETAYLVTSMLESVIERGTGKRVRRSAAGRRQDRHHQRHARRLVHRLHARAPDGVWVGYDSERSLGKEQTGGRVAAPIFLELHAGGARRRAGQRLRDSGERRLVSVQRQTSSASRRAPSRNRGRRRGARRASTAPCDAARPRAVATRRRARPRRLQRRRLDHEEPTWPAPAGDYELAPARGTEGRELDDRPPPRADDYLEPRRDRPDDDGLHPERQRLRAPAARADHEARGRLSRERPGPPPRRRIVEEPLPY